MEIINEMFQRQARRLESQFSDQSANRNSLEVLQSQLQVVQAQLQWQSARSHETSQQATQSAESVARMRNYMNTMESDRARAVQTAQRLARAVTSLRSQLEASDPQKYAELMPHLSELTMTGCNLASLDGIGELPRKFEKLPEATTRAILAVIERHVAAGAAAHTRDLDASPFMEEEEAATSGGGGNVVMALSTLMLVSQRVAAPE